MVGRLREVAELGHWRSPALFVAANTAGHFTGLDGHETLHPLDRHPLLVHCHEEQAPPSRHLKVGRAIRFDRDRSKDAFERKCATVTERVHTARKVDWLGQGLDHQQLLDLATSYSRHVLAFVDIGQHQRTGRSPRLDPVGDDRFGARATSGRGS